MLELLLVWLGITGMVEGVNYSVYFKLINYIYSSGYKINYDNLLKYSLMLKENNMYENKIGKMLIPVVNARYVDKKGTYLTKNKSKIMNMLSRNFIIEDMDDNEYMEYLANPSVKTALNITFSTKREKIDFLKYLLVEINRDVCINENDNKKINTLILEDSTVIKYLLHSENGENSIKVINEVDFNKQGVSAEELVRNTYIMLGNKAKTGELDLDYLSRYLKENNGVLDLRKFNLAKSKSKK